MKHLFTMSFQMSSFGLDTTRISTARKMIVLGKYSVSINKLSSLTLFKCLISCLIKYFVGMTYFSNDKTDDFRFPIRNIPFTCCYIPAAPAYGVYIPQLIGYSRACISYHDFFYRWLMLSRKQKFQVVILKNHLLENVTDAIMGCLTIMEYLFYR